jgi:hypothetical protein
MVVIEDRVGNRSSAGDRMHNRVDAQFGAAGTMPSIVCAGEMMIIIGEGNALP